jgi:hypothetical protein
VTVQTGFTLCKFHENDLTGFTDLQEIKCLAHVNLVNPVKLHKRNPGIQSIRSMAKFFGAAGIEPQKDEQQDRERPQRRAPVAKEREGYADNRA